MTGSTQIGKVLKLILKGKFHTTLIFENKVFKSCFPLETHQVSNLCRIELICILAFGIILLSFIKTSFHLFSFSFTVNFFSSKRGHISVMGQIHCEINSIERFSLFSTIYFSKYIERMPNVKVQNSKQIIFNSSTTSLLDNAPNYLVRCIIQKRLATFGTKKCS